MRNDHVGEMIVGEKFVGEMSVGEMIVSEMKDWYYKKRDENKITNFVRYP
jgi:hypothetical protein